MTMSIINSIVLLLKAIPIADKWASAFVESYIKNRIQIIENEKIDIIKKRSAILNAITEAKTHDEKRILFSALNDIK